jgi:hypothetical protein
MYCLHLHGRELFSRKIRKVGLKLNRTVESGPDKLMAIVSMTEVATVEVNVNNKQVASEDTLQQRR